MQSKTVSDSQLPTNVCSTSNILKGAWDPPRPDHPELVRLGRVSSVSVSQTVVIHLVQVRWFLLLEVPLLSISFDFWLFKGLRTGISTF